MTYEYFDKKNIDDVNKNKKVELICSKCGFMPGYSTDGPYSELCYARTEHDITSRYQCPICYQWIDSCIDFGEHLNENHVLSEKFVSINIEIGDQVFVNSLSTSSQSVCRIIDFVDGYPVVEFSGKKRMLSIKYDYHPKYKAVVSNFTVREYEYATK